MGIKLFIFVSLYGGIRATHKISLMICLIGQRWAG